MKSSRKKRKKAGLPPGSLVFTGDQKVDKASLHYLLYNSEELEEATYFNHEEINFQKASPDKVDWYDVRGLHDTQLIESFGKSFDVHNLVLEDVVDVNQRAKYEEYPNGNFIVLSALSFNEATYEVSKEQVGLFFQKGLLLSFQENETDLFVHVRERLHAGRGRIRHRGADYLCYALMDSIVDHYFNVLDDVERVVERLEEGIVEGADIGTKAGIHKLKTQVVHIRRTISPLREAIGRFSKSDSPDIDEGTKIYLRDLYDHTIQIIDAVDSIRDILNGIQDLYISEISMRMNQVMQVLTIITTIFVPLSFLAGLYGMNFEYIPELQYRYGYFVLLGAMALIFIGALIYFNKKKWL